MWGSVDSFYNLQVQIQSIQIIISLDICTGFGDFCTRLHVYWHSYYSSHLTRGLMANKCISQNVGLHFEFLQPFSPLQIGNNITLTWIMYFSITIAHWGFGPVFCGFKLGFNQHTHRFSAPSWHLGKWNSNSLTYKAAAWDGPTFSILQPWPQREVLILIPKESHFQ